MKGRGGEGDKEMRRGREGGERGRGGEGERWRGGEGEMGRGEHTSNMNESVVDEEELRIEVPQCTHECGVLVYDLCPSLYTLINCL